MKISVILLVKSHELLCLDLLPTFRIEGNYKFQLEASENKGLFSFHLNSTLVSTLHPGLRTPAELTPPALYDVGGRWS